MDRRKFLYGIGGTAIGGSALVGSGAFSRIESQRRVKIEVARDPDALLGLDECPDSPNSSYTFIDDDTGHLNVDISPENETEGGGQGVNSDSFTYFDNLFQICNQGKQPVGIWIEADDNPELADPPEEYDDDLPRVQFYNTDDPDALIAEKADAFTLEVGECKCIGMRVMTKGLKAGDQLLEDDEIVIHADSETLTADGRVRNARTGDRYTSIQAAIDDAEPTDTIEVLEGATFDENVVIDTPVSLVAVSNTRPSILQGVSIETDGVSIDGFRVENDGVGISLEPGISDVTIVDNDIESETAQAIADEGPGGIADLEIVGNDLHTGGSGTQVVYIHGGFSGGELTNPATDVSLMNNTISADDLDGGLGVGLEAEGGDVSGNTFDDPPTTFGHLELWGPNLTVEDNDFFGDELGEDAFYVRDSATAYDLSAMLGANTFDPTADVVGDDIRPADSE